MRHKVSSIHRFSMGVGLGKYITTSMTTLVNHSLKKSFVKKVLGVFSKKCKSFHR